MWPDWCVQSLPADLHKHFNLGPLAVTDAAIAGCVSTALHRMQAPRGAARLGCRVSGRGVLPCLRCRVARCRLLPQRCCWIVETFRQTWLPFRQKFLKRWNKLTCACQRGALSSREALLSMSVLEPSMGTGAQRTAYCI